MPKIESRVSTLTSEPFVFLLYSPVSRPQRGGQFTKLIIVTCPTLGSNRDSHVAISVLSILQFPKASPSTMINPEKGTLSPFCLLMIRNLAHDRLRAIGRVK